MQVFMLTRHYFVLVLILRYGESSLFTGQSVIPITASLETAYWWSRLPVEVIFNVFKFLPIQDLCKLAEVCRGWKQLVFDEPEAQFLWKEVFEFRLGGSLNTLSYRVACVQIAKSFKERFPEDPEVSSANTPEVAGLKLCWASRQGHTTLAWTLLRQWGTGIVNGWFLQPETLLYASPLFLAAQEGRYELISLLASFGACINSAAEDDGSTALLIATQARHSAVVKKLLELGADPCMSRKDGITPLYIASQNGFKELVELFVKYGADINRRVCYDGATPLFIASQNGHHEVVYQLLRSGADTLMPRNDGVTPVFIASQNAHFKVVQYLVQAAPSCVNTLTFNGVSELFIACFKGHLEVVNYLLHHGSDPNITCQDGATPLYIAAKHGSHEMVSLLLSARANPNLPYFDGSTALIVAAQRGLWKVVEVLLASRRVVADIARFDGETAWSLAAEGGYREILELLAPHFNTENEQAMVVE